MPNLSGAIRRLKACTATIYHVTGSFVNTRWVPGAPATTACRVRVQPLSPREAAIMPEGIRERAQLAAWLPDGLTLRTVDVVGQGLPDRLVIADGQPFAGAWVALQVQDWRQHGGFTKAILTNATISEV